MELREKLKQLLIPRPPGRRISVEPGLYHYVWDEGGTYTRFHLRVEGDGAGLLLANASASARLSVAGVLIARELLEGVPQEQILRDLTANFRGVPAAVMQKDVARVDRLLRTLGNREDNYPISNLEDAAVSPYEARLIAPLEAAVPLAGPEKMRPILERLWEAAIPHVTFLVPHSPNVEHLVLAMERAEDLGMIAGVRGRASDLSGDNVLADLALAGVDHITVLYASADPAVHDALVGEGDHALAGPLLAAILVNEIAAVAEIPLVEQTVPVLQETLAALREIGEHNYSFFAIAAQDEMGDEARAGALRASAMPQTADLVEELANQMDVRFIWQPPVERNPARSLAEQVQAGPRCSGDVAVRVEPDGEVIPARGPYRSAGNILTHEWHRIWNNQAFRQYRERVESPTRCDDCPGLVICAADCPRKRAGWAQ